MLGWTLLGLALQSAITWFFWYPHAKDFGVIAADATRSAIISVPSLPVGSACFLLVSRKPNPSWARYLYWAAFGVAVLIWLSAAEDLCNMPTRD